MDNTNEKKLVTLNVNGSWQPVYIDTGATAEFWAFLRCYVVDSLTVTFHGMWTNEEEAMRFAQSLGEGSPRVRKIAPYWYAPAYGVVE